KGREKYGRLLIFRKAQIFPVFDNTNNLYPRAILQSEIPSDCIGYRAKQPASKVPIHYSDRRSIPVAMPSKVSGSRQACTGGIEVPGRDVVPVGHRSDIRWAALLGCLPKDIRPAAGGIN